MRDIKPYLISAHHRRVVDSGLTPQVIVDTTWPGVIIPPGYDNDGRIILNISAGACDGLLIDENSAVPAISFNARFNRVSHYVYIPMQAVLGVMAKETGGAYYSFEMNDVARAIATINAKEKPDPYDFEIYSRKVNVDDGAYMLVVTVGLEYGLNRYKTYLATEHDAGVLLTNEEHEGMLVGYIRGFVESFSGIFENSKCKAVNREEGQHSWTFTDNKFFMGVRAYPLKDELHIPKILGLEMYRHKTADHESAVVELVSRVCDLAVVTDINNAVLSNGEYFIGDDGEEIDVVFGVSMNHDIDGLGNPFIDVSADEFTQFFFAKSSDTGLSIVKYMFAAIEDRLLNTIRFVKGQCPDQSWSYGMIADDYSIFFTVETSKAPPASQPTPPPQTDNVVPMRAKPTLRVVK